MATRGFLAFDPAMTGTASAELPAVSAGAGGGAITGAGTYYSLPSEVGHNRNQVSEIIKLTGTLAGTLSIEVGNHDVDAERDALAVWVPFSTVIPAITSGMAAFGISNVIRYSRYRMKFVYTSGSGTLSARRAIKGAT